MQKKKLTCAPILNQLESATWIIPPVLLEAKHFISCYDIESLYHFHSGFFYFKSATPLSSLPWNFSRSFLQSSSMVLKGPKINEAEGLPLKRFTSKP
jgi:hypothetical protein